MLLSVLGKHCLENNTKVLRAQQATRDRGILFLLLINTEI